MDERNRRSHPEDTETVIRKMTDSDCEGQAYVIFSSWHDTYPGMIDSEFLKGITLEKCIESARRNIGSCFVAETGGRITGTAVFGECRDEDLKESGEIYALYVLKEFRNKGIGRKLMDACMNVLPQNTIAVKALTANRNAIRFYQSYGFKPDCQLFRMLGTMTEETRLLFQRK